MTSHYVPGNRTLRSVGAHADPLRWESPKDIEDSPVLACVDANWIIIGTSPAWQRRVSELGLEPYLKLGGNYRIFCRSFLSENVVQHPLLCGLSSLSRGEMDGVRHAFNLADGSSAEIAVDMIDIQGGRRATLTLVGGEEMAERCRQKMLLDEREQLSRSLLIRVQAEERRSVARELHDSAGQYLTAISLVLTRMGQIQCSPEMNEMVSEAGSLVDDFHQRVRAITYVLHPPELEEGGLCVALRSLCAGLARRSPMQINLNIYGEALADKGHIEAIAYRVIQEGLTNVLRHARATLVQVRLCLRPENLLLVVQDNGVGLNSQRRISGEEMIPGVGIAGITARVSKLGGRLKLRDSHGQSGTFLAAVFPRGNDGRPRRESGAAPISAATLNRLGY